MQSISPYNSGKIRIISFVLVVMVLYIHSWYLEAEGFNVASKLQVIIAQGLFSMAIPLFYAISGYLFFLNVSALKDVIRKQSRRIKTLLVPYVLWNLIFMLWYLVLDQIPQISQYVNSNPIGQLMQSSPMEGFYILFVEPAGFHLWFLRDLIVFVSISPVLFFCLRRTSWLLPIACAVLGLKYSFLNSLSFFAMGGAFSIKSFLKNDTSIRREIVYIALLFWILGSVLLPFYPVLYNYLIIIQIVGVLGVWGVFDIIMKKYDVASTSHNKIFGYTFFIYVFHEPFFNIIKKLTLKVIGESDITLSALFLVNPLIALIIILLIAKCLEIIMPNTYKLLTGGR